MKNQVKSQEQIIKEREAFWASNSACKVSKFKHFWDLVIDHEQDSSTNTNSPQKRVPFFLVEIDQLEDRATNFINDELTSSGLVNKVEATNLELKSLLSEIKFFTKNPVYFTYSLKTGFSAEDQEKWNKIGFLLASVYDAETGCLKAIQDHLLFRVSQQKLASLVDKATISLEEELFLRGVLVKGYLLSFYQLVLPFYNVSDNVLVNFKKQRISHLQGKKKSAPNKQASEFLHNEVMLLDEQTNKLELNIRKSKAAYNIQREEIELSCEEVLARSLRVRDGSIVLEAIRVNRYLSFFLRHKGNINALEFISKFGFFRSSSYIAKCLPFLPVAVEAGTQLNDNKVTYSYEKQLKVAIVIDNLKSNLLALEQQVTKHYTRNYFRLLEELTTSQQPVWEVPEKSRFNSSFLFTEEKQRITNKEVIEAAARYQANTSAIQEQVRIISSYRKKITQKQSLLSRIEQKIAERGVVLRQLSREFTGLETKPLTPKYELAVNGKELAEKNTQWLKQWELLSNSHEDSGAPEESTDKEVKPLGLKEKTSEEMTGGSFHPPLVLNTQQQEDERDIIIRMLVDKRDELQEQLCNQGGSLNELESTGSSQQQKTLEGPSEELAVLTEDNKKLEAIILALQQQLQGATEQTPEVGSSKLQQVRNKRYKLSANKYGKLLKKHHKASRKYQREENVSAVTGNRYEFREQLSGENHGQQAGSTSWLASHSPPTTLSKIGLFILVAIPLCFLTMYIWRKKGKRQKRKTVTKPLSSFFKS